MPASPPAIADEALATALPQPNAQVLKLDQHQPEFTETFATYSAHVLSATRIANGQGKYAATALPAARRHHQPLRGCHRADARDLGAGDEFRQKPGRFLHAIDALATLAWERRHTFFAA